MQVKGVFKSTIELSILPIGTGQRVRESMNNDLANWIYSCAFAICRIFQGIREVCHIYQAVCGRSY